MKSRKNYFEFTGHGNGPCARTYQIEATVFLKW